MLRRTTQVVIVATLLIVACGADEASTPEHFFTIGETPHSLVVVDDVLWVLDTEGGELLQLDVTDGSITARIADNTDGKLIQFIDGSIWLLGNFGTSRVDPVTATVVASTDASYSSLASVNGRLFAIRDGDLYELQPDSAEEMAKIELPTDSPGFDREVLWMPLAASGEDLWVGVSDGGRRVAAALHPATGRLGEMIAFEDVPASTAVVGKVVWLLDRQRTLLGINADTGEEIDSVDPLPAGASVLDEYPAFAVGPDGSLWAVDQPGQVVYLLDGATGEVLGQFKLTYRPSSIFVTEESVWIASHYDGRVTRLPRSAVV